MSRLTPEAIAAMAPIGSYCPTCKAEPDAACDPRVAPLGPTSFMFHDERLEAFEEMEAENRAESRMNRK